MPTFLAIDDLSIQRASHLLREGKLVAFPTETVYGIGADASNGQAVAAIYTAKGRPTINPLIVHVATTEALENLIFWNDTARLLATQLWPGPLTLILPRRPDAPISLLVSAGLDTLAVRIPSHNMAQKLLRACKVPVAAPSANLSGKLSPTTPQHVAQSLGDKVDLILAGGRTPIGLESTVIDLSVPKPIILRPGAITREQVELIMGGPVEVFDALSTLPTSLASPGMLKSHYAPHLPLRLNAESADEREAFLGFGPMIGNSGARKLNLSLSGDLSEAAANLFAMLQELDKPVYSGIAVSPIPSIGLGAAINDRLARAATR